MRPAAIGLTITLTRGFVVAVGCIVLHVSGTASCLLARIASACEEDKKRAWYCYSDCIFVLRTFFVLFSHLLRHSQGVAVPVHLPQFGLSPQWPPPPRDQRLHVSSHFDPRQETRSLDSLFLSGAAFLLGRPCSLLPGLPLFCLPVAFCLFCLLFPPCHSSFSSFTFSLSFFSSFHILFSTFIFVLLSTSSSLSFHTLPNTHTQPPKWSRQRHPSTSSAWA